ncbi:MAG: hypothetical protein DA407_05100 [Bacteroidetes bacterium]|nr:MAG: hypothetical protein DA407_05100 [Bacteroidota bacterium]
MKKVLYFVFTISILMLWSSCRKDFQFDLSSGNLEFSKDTVYLDTVFSNIGSSTYNLKVYNNSDNDIVIPSLRLSQGQNSMYRLNVDGQTGSGAISGKEFENIEILAKDSMYIFIETTIDIQQLVASETQFLYTDAIEFDAGNNLQKVELITLVKDAVFIYPQRFLNAEGEYITETLTFDVDGDGMDDDTTIEGRFLDDSELTFTNEKPYVIYGYAAIADGKTLTIDAGARIHFHSNSGMLVTSGGSINAQGSISNDEELMEGEIIFEGHRLEPGFSDVPGQWQTIWLFNGSINNTFDHVTIKNSTVGILSEGNQDDNSKLNITNTQIYNSSNFGILGRATSINAENLVINNSGQSSFAGTYGGRYNVVHSTLANYWNNSFRQFPSLLLNNYVVDVDNVTFTNPLEEANFTNTIIYGNDNPEMLLDKDNDDTFNFKFTNCLIRFNDSNNNFNGDQYDFDNNALYENVLFNDDPEFLDPYLNMLQIPNGSPADGFGIISGNLFSDILGTMRTTPRDLGAYESIVFEED